MTQSSHSEESLHALRVTLKAHQYILKLLKTDMQTYQLSENEFMVLELLYHKGAHPIQQIGQHVLIPNSSLTYVMDQLEDKQLMKREQSSKDKRVLIASITPQGEAMIKEAFKSHKQCIDAIFSALTDEEVAQYIQLTKKIGKNTQTIVENLKDEKEGVRCYRERDKKN